MTRTAVVGLLLVAAVILQTSVFPLIAFAGFRPDLMILLTALFALRDGVATGVRVGFMAGLLTDLLVNESAIGLAALILVGLGYGIGALRPYLAPESVTTPILAAFLGTLAAAGGYGLLTMVLSLEQHPALFVLEASLLTAFYNTLLAPFALFVVNRVSRAFPAERAVLTP